MHQSKIIEADIVIAGGGCAGLSLALALLNEQSLKSKKIIILEKDVAKANDRTWCYWENGAGKLDHILDAKWNAIHVGYGGELKKIPLHSFHYKLIRGERFYNYAYEQISKSANIEIIEIPVTHMESKGDFANFYTPSGEIFKAKMGFNSLPPKLQAESHSIDLLQHFKGWWVETDADTFDTNTATLMDFNIEQYGDCRFVYVLPLSARKALVEYTIFSSQILKPEDYDKALSDYMAQNFYGMPYTIKEYEFGVIPMSSRLFPLKHSPKIWNIGTAGGQTKASTGYTFYNIQKHSKEIAQSLARGVNPKANTPFFTKRFRLYDNTLLHVLYHQMMPGAKIFNLIFNKNPVASVFRFLSNESSLADELRIMYSLPVTKFLPAALKEWAKMLRY
jgi:lycopene beta-cyclase